MAVEFAASCNIDQGYNFKQAEHHTFGYINTFVLGDNEIVPDIKVVDPIAIGPSAAAWNTGAGGSNTDTSGIFTRPVFCVLETVTWSTIPSANIMFRGRISPANADQLNVLLMQSLRRFVVKLSFSVYRYDLVNQKYFTHFLSFSGTAPKGAPVLTGGGTGFVNDSAAKPIFGLLGKTSGTQFGLRVGSKPLEEPAGIRNFTFELLLAPPMAETPQQILIQTSDTIKIIQAWGLPQS